MPANFSKIICKYVLKHGYEKLKSLTRILKFERSLHIYMFIENPGLENHPRSYTRHVMTLYDIEIFAIYIVGQHSSYLG